MPENIKPIDWDTIVKTIERKRCILFIGPCLHADQSGKSLQSSYFMQLAKDFRDDILAYNDVDGFFLFKDAAARINIMYKIIDFYASHANHAVLEKIAEIPFHTIISITPDTALKDTFDKMGLPCNFEYFEKTLRKDIEETPTEKKPLIYNLYGSITNEESLVLTHDDLFEYVKAMLANNTIPVEVRSNLESAYNLIFIGFEFDKWYIQLILSLLNIDKFKFSKYASTQDISNQVQTLYTNHFKINFINAQIDNFIDTLHQKFSAKNSLRKGSSTSASVIEKKDDRKTELLKNIDRQYKLLADYEKKRDLADDPKTIMSCEDEIDNIKSRIDTYENELNQIAP
jgi:hypothetical protein